METKQHYTIREISWPGRTFLAKRALVPLEKIPAFFSESYTALYADVQSRGVANGAPFAIWFTVDEVKKETDVAAAVPVTDPNTVPPGFTKIEIPPAKALLINYSGPFENMKPAYEALDEYLAGKKWKKEWMLEEYLSDPETEKNPADWKTNIYYIIRD